MVIDFLDLLLRFISKDVPRILSVLVRTILLFLFFWYCTEFIIEFHSHPVPALAITILVVPSLSLMFSSFRQFANQSSAQRLSVAPGPITTFSSLNLLPTL